MSVRLENMDGPGSGRSYWVCDACGAEVGTWKQASAHWWPIKVGPDYRHACSPECTRVVLRRLVGALEDRYGFVDWPGQLRLDIVDVKTGEGCR